MHYFSGISDSHVVNNVTSMHETQFQMSFLNICLQKCFTLYGNDFQKSKQFNFILSPRFTETNIFYSLILPVTGGLQFEASVINVYFKLCYH